MLAETPRFNVIHVGRFTIYRFGIVIGSRESGLGSSNAEARLLMKSGALMGGVTCLGTAVGLASGPAFCTAFLKPLHDEL